jgi:hypothetical protein
MGFPEYSSMKFRPPCILKSFARYKTYRYPKNSTQNSISDLCSRFKQHLYVNMRALTKCIQKLCSLFDSSSYLCAEKKRYQFRWLKISHISFNVYNLILAYKCWFTFPSLSSVPKQSPNNKFRVYFSLSWRRKYQSSYLIPLNSVVNMYISKHRKLV